MPYSRKQFSQSFILFKDKKTVTGYFSSAKLIADNPSRNESKINTISDLEKKIVRALGNGNEVTITYYDGTGFQKIRGYVQSYHPQERRLSVVHFTNQWNVQVYDIVRIEE